jgi:hypothetical protein
MSLMLLTLAIASADPATAATPPACRARSGALTVPLVELYTSEGCSSCPPADRWFARSAGNPEANWLAFHVDYWDELGWRDRFATRAHTRRQRDRAWAWSSATIYTPQVMLGTSIHAPWRSPPEFAAQLAAARAPARAGIALRLRPLGGDRWEAKVSAAPVAAAHGTEALLWLARYEDAQSTQVRAGENRGASLRHERVVRQLWGPWPLAAKPTLRRVDVRQARGEWGLVAFVQDARGDTLQTLRLAAPACAALSGSAAPAVP